MSGRFADPEAAAFAALRQVQEYSAAHGYDFAATLTNLVAAVAAAAGGAGVLVAGRPGSWEAAAICSWMQSAGVGIPEVGHGEYAADLRRRWDAS